MIYSEVDYNILRLNVLSWIYITCKTLPLLSSADYYSFDDAVFAAASRYSICLSKFVNFSLILASLYRVEESSQHLRSRVHILFLTKFVQKLCNLLDINSYILDYFL